MSSTADRPIITPPMAEAYGVNSVKGGLPFFKNGEKYQPDTMRSAHGLLFY
jgi:hypothetical protein